MRWSQRQAISKNNEMHAAATSNTMRTLHNPLTLIEASVLPESQATPETTQTVHTPSPLQGCALRSPKSHCRSFNTPTHPLLNSHRGPAGSRHWKPHSPLPPQHGMAGIHNFIHSCRLQRGRVMGHNQESGNLQTSLELATDRHPLGVAGSLSVVASLNTPGSNALVAAGSTAVHPVAPSGFRVYTTLKPSQVCAGPLAKQSQPRGLQFRTCPSTSGARLSLTDSNLVTAGRMLLPYTL